MGIFSRLGRAFSARTDVAQAAQSVEARVDGWFSALSGYGVEGKDKRMSTRFQSDLLDDNTIMDLWRGDDLAARVVETVPNEALRQGFTLNAGDKQLAEDMMGMMETLNASKTILFAKKVERAFGGSAIFPVINDGQVDMIQPLNEDRISSVRHLQVFEPRELQPNRYYEDPLAPKFGEPMTYRLFPQARAVAVRGIEVHESRLIIFPGIRVSRSQVSPNNWGDSVLNRCWRVLRDFNISWAATTALLHDFSQASYKIKGLAELISHDKDDIIKARIQAVELARSTIRAVLMDSEEEFERKQTPVSGLAELLDRLATRLAACADMPVTLLMGQSPAGLNATGESDIRFFYDRISVVQELGIKPQLERLTYLLFRSLDGPTKGKEPNEWSVVFNPLWQPTEKEKAETRKIVAETDNIYFQMGALSPEEIALSHWSGDTYSPEIVVDFEERKRLNTAAETAAPPAPMGVPEIPEEAMIEGGGSPIPGESAPAGGEPVEDDEEEMEAEVEEVDTDKDPKTPPDEFITIEVRGHKRRVKLKRRSS